MKPLTSVLKSAAASCAGAALWVSLSITGGFTGCGEKAHWPICRQKK